MKFTNIGKALLTGALTAGVILGLTSCSSSYTVGYLYVTETPTSSVAGSGQIAGFAIDHNTGGLSQVSGLPVGSGGANPSRAALLSGGRYLYVLNRGANSNGGADCHSTSDPYLCKNANISVFSVGGGGALTFQQSYYTPGNNPFRMFIDSTGTYLYVLEYNAPVTAAASSTNPCTAALGSSVSACGDIAAFSIDSSSGRLSLVSNSQISTAVGATVNYFPVPSYPVDFVYASGFVHTLYASAASSYANGYSGGASVFPYQVSSASSSCGLLCKTSSGSSKPGFAAATAINAANGYVYVLDNTTPRPSYIWPFTVNTSTGALQAQTGGAVVDATYQPNPMQLLVESDGKWAYVANYGDSSNSSYVSGINGYTIDSSTKQLSTLAGAPWGIGSGPVCLVEDPSNQYLFTANAIGATVTGRSIDHNTGDLRGSISAGLDGPATWCLVSGRTN